MKAVDVIVGTEEGQDVSWAEVHEDGRIEIITNGEIIFKFICVDLLVNPEAGKVKGGGLYEVK